VDSACYNAYCYQKLDHLMDKKEGEELTKLIVDSLVANKRTMWFGEGKYCIWLFLDELYKQGFEISVRKK